MEKLLIEEVVNLLRVNKEYPSYQAERRVDIFINHFLKRILYEYDKNIKDLADPIPEFPLFKKPDPDSKRKFDSTKLDYLCYNKEEILFVELKTDGSSLKTTQAEIYFEHIKWEKCFKDFTNLVADAETKNSKYLPKYKYLESKLQPLSNRTGDVRFLYLSPIEEKQKNSELLKMKTKIGQYPIIEPKSFAEIKFKMTEVEKIVWDYLCEIKMFVFELKQQN